MGGVILVAVGASAWFVDLRRLRADHERADEETLFPVCHEHGLGYEAFGPLAGGWLAGRYRRGEVYPEGSRMTQRPDGYRRYESDAVFDALEAFECEARELGVSPAGLAIGADVALALAGRRRHVTSTHWNGHHRAAYR